MNWKLLTYYKEKSFRGVTKLRIKFDGDFRRGDDVEKMGRLVLLLRDWITYLFTKHLDFYYLKKRNAHVKL